MANVQEAFYTATLDYREGSPHLAFPHLRDRLVALLEAEVDRLAGAGLPLRALELGSGHGGFTEPLLAAGCAVVAVEMSRPSVERLRARFGHNPAFEARYDPDGDLAGVGGDFGLVAGVSVLHHIPDYLAALGGLVPRLVPGGSLVTLQDPLWYPRADPWAHRLDRLAYDLWRLRRGDLVQGGRNRLRRRRGAFDESQPADMVEYHVVRQGVDEEAIVAALSPAFDSVDLVRYWSNQSPAGQWLGERLGRLNTFGVVARGARPPTR
jgi:SAM-dependent methyltransferase